MLGTDLSLGVYEWVYRSQQPEQQRGRRENEDKVKSGLLCLEDVWDICQWVRVFRDGQLGTGCERGNEVISRLAALVWN